MKVLLVEDDRSVRASFAEVVAAAGHAVIEAEDGAVALALFEQERPDLVVVDMDAAGIDGVEVVRRIRAREDGHAPFLLVVAARDGTADLQSVLDAGADDYLSKPARPDHLAARLTIATRRMGQEAARRRAEDELARARWLAGIGETSIALQHEINNPLAALLGHAALIQNGLAEPGEERELLQVIVEQAQRIAAVVKRLSALREPRTVEYLPGARMIDLSKPKPD